MGELRFVGAARVHVRTVIAGLRVLRHATLLSLLLLAAALATPALAEPLKMPFADPVDQADPALDIVQGEVQQNPQTGEISARVELAGAPQPGQPLALRILMGNVAPNGTCVARKGGEFVTLMRLDAPTVTWKLGLKDTYGQRWGDGAGTVTGNVIELTVRTDGRLQGSIGTCTLVSIGSSTVWPDPLMASVDDALGKAELAPVTVGGQAAPGPTGDRDRDGVADLVDRCPSDPGLMADGCPDVPGGKSLRLGARRLVVVRLMAKVDGVTTCPAVAKVIVSQSRRLGAAKLPVTESGTFCEVRGVVRLKRHRRNSVVRVELSGNGLASVTQRLPT